MYNTEDMEEVSRGLLTPEQLVQLDEILVSHGLPESSPFVVPDTLVSACLLCGSVSQTSDAKSRDFYVDSFMQACCGLTVVWHSNQRTLTDPGTLPIVLTRGD